MKKIGYIRVSTDKQNVDRQIDLLATHSDDYFIDYAISASGPHRPAYDKALAALQRGDSLVVLSFERAYRSPIDAYTEVKKLEERGIGFVCVQQPVDTCTPTGRLIFFINSAVAEWERETLRQRTREGMAAAKRRGKHVGRPRKLSQEQIDWARQKLSECPRPDIHTLSAKLNVSKITLQRALA